jgi:hypothetical protein
MIHKAVTKFIFQKEHHSFAWLRYLFNGNTSNISEKSSIDTLDVLRSSKKSPTIHYRRYAHRRYNWLIYWFLAVFLSAIGFGYMTWNQSPECKMKQVITPYAPQDSFFSVLKRCTGYRF